MLIFFHNYKTIFKNKFRKKKEKTKSVIESENGLMMIRSSAVKKNTITFMKPQTQKSRHMQIGTHNSNEKIRKKDSDLKCISPIRKNSSQNNIQNGIRESSLAQNGNSPKRKSTSKFTSNSERKPSSQEKKVTVNESKPNVFKNYSNSIQKNQKCNSSNTSQNISANTSGPIKKPETPKYQIKKIFIKEKEIEENDIKHVRSNSKDSEKIEMKKNIEFTTTIKKNLKDKIDKLNSKGSTHENEEKIKSKLPPNLPREIKTIALKKGLLVNPTQQKASNILTQLLKTGSNKSTNNCEISLPFSKQKFGNKSLNILNYGSNPSKQVELIEKKI